MYLLGVSTVEAVLGAIGALVVLLVLAGGTWAIIVTARKDKAEKRLSSWVRDLTARLDYVEPRLEKTLAENNLLRTLANPTAAIEKNHTETIQALGEQHETLVEIRDMLAGRGKP